MAKNGKRSWLSRNKIGNWKNVWARRVGIIILTIPICLCIIPLRMPEGITSCLITIGGELEQLWRDWTVVIKGAKSSWKRNKTYSKEE